MMKGRNNGKKQLAIRIVKHALEIIHLTTGENPLQILIDAISAGGAREDSTRIGTGGVVRRQAVDVSPLRRINQAMYLYVLQTLPAHNLLLLELASSAIQLHIGKVSLLLHPLLELPLLQQLTASHQTSHLLIQLLQ